MPKAKPHQMPVRRVILAKSKAANDNFVAGDRVLNRFERTSCFAAARRMMRVPMTAGFSLLLLLLISAVLLGTLALVGVFAAVLAVFRLISRRPPHLVVTIYQLDRRAPG